MKFTKRQTEILEQAIHLVAQKGIQSLTTKNLAAAMNFSEPAIYRHFKNKTAVLSGILDYCGQSIPAIPYEPGDPIAALDQFMSERYLFFSNQPDLAKVMFSEAAFQNEPELGQKALEVMHQHKDAIAPYLKETLEQGLLRAPVGIKELFRLIIGPLRLTVGQWCLSGYAFDLQAEGNKLWQSAKLFLFEES